MCVCMFLALIMVIFFECEGKGASLRRKELQDQMSIILFRLFMTCIKMLLLLYVGCAVSCCPRNWADGAGSQSELRAEGKTRTGVMPFSSALADEGTELQAAVSYSALPLLGREMAKVGFLGGR